MSVEIVLITIITVLLGILCSVQPSQQEYLQRVVHFVVTSETQPQSTSYICWRKYLKDFVKLEFRDASSFNDNVMDTLAEYFYHMLESETDVFNRFIKLHACVSVRHLNIVRCLPTFSQLQDCNLKKFLTQKNLMQTFSDTESDQLSSLFIDTLYNIVSEVLSISSDDSSKEFKAWHELFLQSVS